MKIFKDLVVGLLIYVFFIGFFFVYINIIKASNDKDRPQPVVISGLIFKQVMITEPSALIGYNAQREMLSNLCDKYNGEFTTERGGGSATTSTGAEVYVVTMIVMCMEK